MTATLEQEINARTAARLAEETQNPGCFWGDGGLLTKAEAEVFGISYAEFPRMLSVWDAWFEFLDLIVGGPISYSREAIERERKLRPELVGGNEPDLFARFAMQVGGLTNRQAEAMYWKGWFWTVRNGHVTYADEFMEKYESGRLP